jgi:hypothetical protein
MPASETAYWPLDPFPVRDADENRIVAEAVPESAPKLAVIVTVPPVGGESGAW